MKVKKKLVWRKIWKVENYFNNIIMIFHKLVEKKINLKILKTKIKNKYKLLICFRNLNSNQRKIYK